MHRAKKKSIKQEYRGEGLLLIPADYMARGGQCPFPPFYVRALDGCPRNASESNGGLDGNVLKSEVELLGASAERLRSDGEDSEKEISTQSEGEYRLGAIGSNSDPYWKI
ncbi:hypothetical protein Tco_0141141 [Tanacetum coccineum]